ncbi:unnamed protein product [Durusdinium trenchii]|uniref:PiggyBac transposable element-derived protein domain-containing protein n=1 Tax=Durusdinium trenchii TaxID=1381693 RepID=A0ABP0RN78_9DINO
MVAKQKPLCRKAKDPKRGPLRVQGSKVKLQCAWKNCKGHCDVKNKSFILPIKKVNLSACRALRSHCKTVRFCSSRHLQKCQNPEVKEKRGGREPLTAGQTQRFFPTLVQSCHRPWAAVLMVLQIALGERADAARQACASWFVNLAPDSSGMPTCNIPRVNRKTQQRAVPLDRSFAKLLWQWMTTDPLVGLDCQWPFDGQDLQGAFDSGEDKLLFPGRTLGGKNKRNWSKPITERAYLEALQEACKVLTRERKADRENGVDHPCENLDLGKVGTYSMKKTIVTLLKTLQVSTCIVSAITGTSGRTLDDIYDVPTLERQRAAMKNVISPLVDGISAEPDHFSPKNLSSGVSVTPPCCPACQQSIDASWRLCPNCGQRLLCL